MAAAGMEIGPIPDVVDPRRRARCAKDLRAFCEVYFREIFYLAWSDDHLKAIAKIERAVFRGGLFALAMERGGGKSALIRTAALWAILYAHRRYVVIVAATANKAAGELEKVQAALETDELLAADFPEVIFPITCLERIANRQKGQRHNGQHTRMTWQQNKLILPTIGIDPAFDQYSLAAGPTAASGSILTACGLTGGEIRGQNHYLADGRVVRPDFVMLDDPQTEESAYSLIQCERREKLVGGAVLGMAGPHQKIFAFAAITVIRKGDMADSLLDRRAHPEWQGERFQMVRSFPANTKLWDEYRRVRDEDLRADGDGSAATQFYAANRAAMDAGASVSWPDRFNADEVSAVQHAMNLKFRDEETFFAEYQNDPLTGREGGEELLTADAIAAKVNALEQGVFPAGCHCLTAFIDVHEKLLYWAVCAWKQDFTGAVIDYGSHPDQRRRYFSLREAARTLGRLYQGRGREGAIVAGLADLLAELLDREWKGEDGSVLNVGRCLIDTGWEPDPVYAAIRLSKRGGLVWPSKGQGVTAASKPIAEYDRKRGDFIGHNWWIPSVKHKRVLRQVLIDTNHWKSFCQSRLRIALGDRGALTLWGDNPVRHRLFGEHVAAEYFVRTSGRGRTVDEWKLLPHRPDNHWLDCLVGCAVGASMLGTSTLEDAAPRRKTIKAPRKSRVRYLS
ncbi:MAG TPA: terminase gpA endonuclease subunit [Phycisphaerae bacterium]|nr:terminase gpA endonuclease subunit [Phycisphaerae bacterium]